MKPRQCIRLGSIGAAGCGFDWFLFGDIETAPRERETTDDEISVVTLALHRDVLDATGISAKPWCPAIAIRSTCLQRSHFRVQTARPDPAIPSGPQARRVSRNPEHRIKNAAPPQPPTSHGRLSFSTSPGNRRSLSLRIAAYSSGVRNLVNRSAPAVHGIADRVSKGNAGCWPGGVAVSIRTARPFSIGTARSYQSC